MSRLDCISNRNIKIIATYVGNRLGSHHHLFEGLQYSDGKYSSPEDFFLDEDEWTTYDNFNRIFRKANDLVNEPNFYYNCGFSSSQLRSWGRFHYFVRVFATPNDGFKRLPFFNSTFNDTKEIDIVSPPTYDPYSKKIRTLIKIEFHNDFDLNIDYIGDPYLKGIISSIPTIWGMEPATIKQVLNPYDPIFFINAELGLNPYNFDVRIEGGFMSLKNPLDGQRIIVGEEVFLESELVEGRAFFLGKFSRPCGIIPQLNRDTRPAMLITKDVQIEDRVLLKEGEIFSAPYYILDVSYTRPHFSNA